MVGEWDMELMTARLRELVDEARSDMRTAPTHADWLLDAAAWAARRGLLAAVEALSWRWAR